MTANDYFVHNTNTLPYISRQCCFSIKSRHGIVAVVVMVSVIYHYISVWQWWESVIDQSMHIDRMAKYMRQSVVIHWAFPLFQPWIYETVLYLPLTLVFGPIVSSRSHALNCCMVTLCTEALPNFGLRDSYRFCTRNELKICQLQTRPSNAQLVAQCVLTIFKLCILPGYQHWWKIPAK